MTAIIDYDAGNIKSVEKALASLNEEVIVTRAPHVLLEADRVILPGVGSFGAAMEKLHRYGLVEVIYQIVANKTPFLGVCLGLQLLFERSEECEGIEGLGILKGEIQKIPSNKGVKIPHIGWNSLEIRSNKKIFKNIADGAYVYFVHSYYLKAQNEEIVAATTEYGVIIDAAIEYGNVFACQFHPEKSSDVGLHILKNFLSINREV